MVQRGFVDYAQESGYAGPESPHHDVHVVDLNDDGFDDLLLTPMLLASSARPVAHVFDPASGRFSVDWQFQGVVPTMQHPREVARVDVDGDGRLDVFFANHGYDDAPWGEPNALMLNTIDGFVDGSNLLPEINDYSHGVITADLFGDGVDDLVVLNSFNISAMTKCAAYPEIVTLECGPGPQVGDSYVLAVDGSGGVEVARVAADLNFEPSDSGRLSKGSSADVNGDGIPDLVVTAAGQMSVMESTARGVYDTVARFDPTLLSSTCAGSVFFGDVLIVDLDDDGGVEVITFETCEWDAMQWRVFSRHIDGDWVDETSSWFPDQTANLIPGRKSWCQGFWAVDLDADGDLDLVCNSRSGLLNALWLNDAGSFSVSVVDLLPGVDPSYGETLVARLGDETHLIVVRGGRILSWLLSR